MLLVWHVSVENVKHLASLDGRHHLSHSGDMESGGKH